MATLLAQKAVTVRALQTALTKAWSRKTSADPAGWTEDNAALGQCAVTALIVQDYLGGGLRRGEVGSISHYWNILPFGEELDLTKHQFPADVEIVNVEPRSREYVLSHPDTVRRYRALASAVRASLGTAVSGY
jgi:hypothetical protein